MSGGAPLELLDQSWSPTFWCPADSRSDSNTGGVGGSIPPLPTRFAQLSGVHAETFPLDDPQH